MKTEDVNVNDKVVINDRVYYQLKRYQGKEGIVKSSSYDNMFQIVFENGDQIGFLAYEFDPKK